MQQRHTAFERLLGFRITGSREVHRAKLLLILLVVSLVSK
jgi:hypothetical protein